MKRVPVISRVPILALAFAACDGDSKDYGTDTGINPICQPWDVCVSTDIVYDYSRAGYYCRADFVYPSLCTDSIKGVRVTGTTLGYGEDPGDILVAPPEDCDPAGSTRPTFVLPTGVSGDEWVAEGSDHAFCNVGTDAGAWLNCNSAYQAQSDTWQVFLPEHSTTSCASYGDIMLEFIEQTGPDCNGAAGTPSSTCTPDVDVEIDLYHWAVRDLGGDAYEHSRLMPVINSGGPFTERAWLRSIEVVDWGEASELVIVPYGEYLRVSSGDLIDTTNSIVLDTTNNAETFSAGVVHMGATFAIDGIPPGPTFEAPHIKVEWSCEYNPLDPHFNYIPQPQAYAASLNDLGVTGLDHRVIMRNWPGPSFVSLELEGRNRQRIAIPVTPQLGGGIMFDYVTDMYGGLDIEGDATLSGGVVTVDFDKLIKSGVSYGTPTLEFTEIEE